MFTILDELYVYYTYDLFIYLLILIYMMILVGQCCIIIIIIIIITPVRGSFIFVWIYLYMICLSVIMFLSAFWVKAILFTFIYERLIMWSYKKGTVKKSVDTFGTLKSAQIMSAEFLNSPKPDKVSSSSERIL